MRNIILSTFMMTSIFASFTTNAAAPVTAQFNVTIKVNESCKFDSANDVNFADIDRSTDVNKTAEGKLNITCTLGTPYQVALAGNGKMTNTADTTSTIAYNLYQDPAYAKNWDDSKNLLSNAGSGTSQALPVYAKLAGNTNVKAGNYSDTVTATVTY
ncbi:spore coat U domain-containing protein [uncultured Acinetobacter sp.]|uniref:Csu type fimbrial protein n=1 Tax=uncultured Acinetobacter sp. TaxID=165433 RepID=UPI0025CC162B|nr:spore coat U domain-containing protein [uncultured Acinetobacter sp.]